MVLNESAALQAKKKKWYEPLLILSACFIIFIVYRGKIFAVIEISLT